MAKGRKTGGGSRRGKPNKVSADVRSMVLGALNKAGGEDYLFEQAQENPTAFLSLVGKILPTQLTGDDGAPIQLSVVTGVPPAKP